MFRITFVSEILKGGEMMKKLGLVLILMLVVSGAVMAETVTLDTYAGWNVISLPQVPYEPDPAVAFSQFDMMFTTTLMRFDAPTQANITYDAFATPPTAFGNLLLGDGYSFYNPDAGQVSYDAVLDGVPDAAGTMTDMWISLPGDQNDGVDAGGWHTIGCPFNHDIAIDPNFDFTGSNIQFTDGTTLKGWADAVSAGWVMDSMYYFDGASQSQFAAGFFFNDDDQLRAGKAYTFKTNKDNLAVIIPAY